MAVVTKNAAKVTKATTKGASGKADAKAASVNPYRAGGSYHAVVECLNRLGFGKFHKAAELQSLYPKVVGAEAWKAFEAKDKRTENGKGATDRIVTNAITINRPDYGRPLRELGVECRKQRTADGYEFGLFKIAPIAPLAVEPKAEKKAAATAEPKAAASSPQKAAATPKANGKAKTAPKAAKAQKANQKAAKGKASKGK